MIRDAQRKLGHAVADAFWTHAALYVGDGEIVEANWDRDLDDNPVSRVAVSTYVPHAYIRRRTMPDLSEKMQQAVADQADLRCGEDYSLLAAIDIYIKAQLRQFSRVAPPFVLRRSARGLVCADIVSTSYDHVLRRPAFANTDDDIVVPATLSATGELEDAEIAWCTIPDKSN
ncbi:MAG: hypothetical protein H7099_15835 [Gemmatimonadaceae bacterium]|nr:hypothetical protein [Gemmatimonadaceae bacterium]